MNYYSKMKILFEKVFYNVLWKDDNNQYHYNSMDPYINIDSFEELKEITNEYDEFINSNEEKIDDIMQNEPIMSCCRLIELLDQEEALYELVYFDEEDYTNDYLNEEYGLEAYDEYLDEYVDKSMDAAKDKLQDLAECAESEVTEVFNELKKALDELLEMIDYIHNLQQSETEIDNT